MWIADDQSIFISLLHGICYSLPSVITCITIWILIMFMFISILLPTGPIMDQQPPIKTSADGVGGDFDACRFDFRIDTKHGLTPSKRKRPDRRPSTTTTMFTCKTCGVSFESRPALLAHKAEHNVNVSPVFRSYINSPFEVLINKDRSTAVNCNSY